MNLTVALTGASGAIFGRELLCALEADARVERVHFIPSENSLRVLAEELGISGRNDLIEKLLGAESTESHPGRKNKDAARVGHPDLLGQTNKGRKNKGLTNKIMQHSNTDIGASIASGSYASTGMIVLPCSMGTLAAIANGLADTLIARAADVTLKERRPLVLCVRETPFNRIHLRNMTLAAEAGATIYPVIPTFYNHPADATEMARQFVYRVLAHIGLPQSGAYIWKGDE